MNAQQTIHATTLSTFDVGRSAFDVPAASGDTWQHLRRHTAARIALGRTGGSQHTGSILDFRLAHAQARDAVQSPFDADHLDHALRNGGLPTFRLSTAADNRRTFLLRPELGRTLDDASRKLLFAKSTTWGQRDLAVIVSDGLAAQAAEQHAIELVVRLVKTLVNNHWTIYPIIVVPFARVKLQDEIGELLGARHTLILLGERPGLSSPNSLGAYFTFNPRAGCSDADRNCVSNIRPAGLPPAVAAERLARLLSESARLKRSGVSLKDAELQSPPQLDVVSQ